MRWSASTQVLFARVGFTQRMRCFFQASDIGSAVDGQVDVVHDRAFFDLSRPSTGWTQDLGDIRLTIGLHVGSEAFVRENADVFETETHQGAEDLTRVDQDEGASWLLAHTTSLKRLRLFLGDPGHQGLPLDRAPIVEPLAMRAVAAVG